MTIDEARAALADEDASKNVEYRPYAGKVERGVITSVNDRWVFVQYTDSWQSRATDAGDLTVTPR